MDLHSLRGSVAKLRSAGVSVVIVLPPSATHTRHQKLLRRAWKHVGADALLDYANPETYPEFFSIGMRFDPGHLNGAGAILFSEVLGRDLYAMMRPSG